MPSNRTIPRTCQQCGQEFLAQPSEVNRNAARYCGADCNYAAKRRPIADRFWEKVNIDDNGCWEWTGYRSPSGYGRIGSAGKYGRGLIASRVSYELHYGPIPPGLHVLHSCDNPPCVRPDHLFLGTDADNVADMFSKERQPRRDNQGAKNPRAKLSETEVRELRTRYANGGISMAALAREYGISTGYVHNIISRRTWRHI